MKKSEDLAAHAIETKKSLTFHQILLNEQMKLLIQYQRKQEEFNQTRSINKLQKSSDSQKDEQDPEKMMEIMSNLKTSND